MPRIIYNKAQITKNIAQKVGITQARTERIITELEKQIISLGSSRGRVQIKEFGVFRVYKRKSTTIKQIGTKKNRLIIPQKVIKFIATEKFKQIIRGDRDSAKFQIGQEPTKYNTATKDDSFKTDRGHHISLQPLSYYERVSKERFNELLKQGSVRPALTKSANPQKKYIDDTPDGKIILSIFKLARSQGEKTINFVFENNITYIFTGKPRKIIGKLSNDLCRKFFIDRFNLENDDVPQERIGILEFRHESCGIIIVSIHSLPTQSGSSMVVNFRFK